MIPTPTSNIISRAKRATAVSGVVLLILAGSPPTGLAAWRDADVAPPQRRASAPAASYSRKGVLHAGEMESHSRGKRSRNTRRGAAGGQVVQTLDRQGRSLQALFEAIRQVESGGNDRAIGDGGRSRGPYQCGLLAWIDGGGLPAAYARGALDRTSSDRVMLACWARWGCTTDEQRARCWNGGPGGMHKAATESYWRRVKAALDTQEKGR